MAKKITIEKVAEMVHRGFQDVHSKMDQQFSSLRADVNGLKQDVKELKQDVKGLKQDVVDLKEDVGYLKSRVTEIGITLEKQEDILDEHSTELKWIHKRIDEFTDPRSEKRFITHDEFSRLVLRVDSLEKKIKAKIA